MQLDRPTRREEALHYWNVMQASAADLPFQERREELRGLSRHCRSDVLRDLCKKSSDTIGKRPVRQRLTEMLA